MTVKSFVDTNVALYTIGSDVRKKTIARNLIALAPVVSTQVINECIAVCLRKFSFTRENAYQFAQELMSRTAVRSLTQDTVEKAAKVAIRYQLSHWDALIVASALLADCDALYSEDLQHGQILDDKLKVINPFLSE